MSDSSLIPDLENIVGDYSDVSDYKTLHTINPKVHTADKLLLKQLSHIPETDLLRYTDAYKKALEFYIDNESDLYFSPGFLAVYLMYNELDATESLNQLAENYYTRMCDDPDFGNSNILDRYESELIQLMKDNIVLEGRYTDLESEYKLGLNEYIYEGIDEIQRSFFESKTRYIDKYTDYLEDYRNTLYMKVKEIIFCKVSDKYCTEL